ncbi:DUF6979 family protein [Duganella callida]|uniref:Uncharacterized protein n=1 Tax=Duganella callida TaxID=2561932 RepID=A0A4Y9S6K1_9BURK|nr:hypothetical protein [Duganella callida]TFW17103.1 hypothetical protein E4L98_21435 [Duganella callida]
MGKYGSAAVNAVRAYSSGRASSAIDAWNIAVCDTFPNSPSSQEKSCPKGTFLGICGSGNVVGIPSGEYTTSEKNRRYGLRALEILSESPGLAEDELALWKRVMAGEDKKPNSQMDVVISLWKAGLVN